MAKVAIKSLRGQPELYNETKQRYTMCLTPSTSQLLSDIGALLGLSRSELIEQILRGLVSTQDLDNAKAQLSCFKKSP